MVAAEVILGAHVAIILFNLFGLIAIPIGALRGWPFVRVRWWRVLHLVLLAAVAVQAVAGRACVLTLWQSALSGAAAAPAPMIMSWVDQMIYWRLPIWVFAMLYVAVFGYAAALLWLVPTRRTASGSLMPRRKVPASAGRRRD